MAIKYHLFTANLANYKNIDNPPSFLPLLKEAKKNDNRVQWHIGRKGGKGNHEVRVGDIVLIYYSNLPDNTNRILFYGKVEKTDYGKDINDYIDYDNENKQYGCTMLLRSIDLQNEKKELEYDKLLSYGITQVMGYQKLDEKKHHKLISIIKQYTDNNTGSYLKTVYEYFQKFTQCELDNKHDTFIMKNGFKYIERHHLVERNLINKTTTEEETKKLTKIIEQKENIYKICPLCHRKIHYGTKEEVRQMIEKLYNRNREYFDKNYKDLKNGKSSLEWLYEIYKVN